MTHHCKYCNKKFEYGHSLGGHTASCSKNPNHEKHNKKISIAMSGSSNPSKQQCVVERIKKTINRKIKDGTWHNSFSKSRTHLYNGVRLYGKWEVAYAQWLDKNNIKWRRPKESFVYEFEGSEHRYTPDFFLIDQCLYVEIKGYKTSKDDAKWKQFPLPLKVLMGQELFDMGLISSFKKI